MNNAQDPLVGLSAAETAAMSVRLAQVRSDLTDAARLAGRDPAEITLVGVSKFFPAAAAVTAVELGLTDLGENRVQEMIAKQDALAFGRESSWRQPHWHLIGTLQTNKVKYIIGRTTLIHSVDTPELLSEIARRSELAAVTTDVLIQVNTAAEATKHGFDPADESALLREIRKGAQLPGVRIRGLMTMAPLFEDADLTLPIFHATRDLFVRIQQTVLSDAAFDSLSMGMSHDFRQAIACGSTHVRIGTAIFGPRLI